MTDILDESFSGKKGHSQKTSKSKASLNNHHYKPTMHYNQEYHSFKMDKN